MASDAIQSKRVLKAGVPVVLNLGLMGPSGTVRPKLLPSQRTVLYAEALKEIMQPGFKAEIAAEFDVEPTMIVSGMLSETAANSLLVWRMVVGAEQDCIALQYTLPNGDKEGHLFGPNAEAWGEFDAKFFLQPVGVSHD